MHNTIRGLFNQYLPELSYAIDELTKQRLLDYIALLAKWNKAYNLTAVRHPEEMIPKHLFDSLVIAPYIQGHRILDVGTGPGLPGIPLAMIFPERRFVLLDSNGKKTRFLVQAKHSLALTNIDIVHSRAEAYADLAGFDSIVSRAFAAIDEMLNLTQHLLAPDGQFLAMKGVYPQEELNHIPKVYQVVACHSLAVPGLTAERHLVCITKG